MSDVPAPSRGAGNGARRGGIGPTTVVSLGVSVRAIPAGGPAVTNEDLP